MDHINGDVNQDEADVTEGFSVETGKMEIDGYSMIFTQPAISVI